MTSAADVDALFESGVDPRPLIRRFGATEVISARVFQP
jgi:hypothetical protein